MRSVGLAEQMREVERLVAPFSRPSDADLRRELDRLVPQAPARLKRPTPKRAPAKPDPLVILRQRVDVAESRLRNIEARERQARQTLERERRRVRDLTNQLDAERQRGKAAATKAATDIESLHAKILDEQKRADAADRAAHARVIKEILALERRYRLPPDLRDDLKAALPRA